MKAERQMGRKGRMGRREFIKRGALWVTGAAAFNIFVPKLIRAQTQMLLNPVLVSRSSGWTPQTPGTLAEWLKADAITGYTNGQTLPSWTASYGLNATGTPENPPTPTYATNVQNGLPAVSFAVGTTEELITGNFETPVALPTTVMMSFQMTGTLGGNEQYMFCGGPNENCIQIQEYEGNWYIWGPWEITTPLADLNWHILTVIFDYDAVQYGFDTANLTTGAGCPGYTPPASTFNFGYYSYGAPGFNLGEVCVWRGALSAADITNGYNYMSGKWA
jgi:hypothetical protein